MCMLSFMYALTCRPSLHSSDNRHPTFCDIMTCFSWDGQGTQHDYELFCTDFHMSETYHSNLFSVKMFVQHVYTVTLKGLQS